MHRLPVVLVLPAVFLAACYSYRPVGEPVPLTAGSRIAVQLRPAGAEALAPVIGPDVERLEGELLSADSLRVQIAVRGTVDRRGVSSPWRGERVSLPRDAIQTVERRRLSVGGTSLLGGGLAVGLVALGKALGGSGSASGPGGTTGGRGTR